MDIRIEGLLSSLRLRHIHALFAENSADARQKVMGLIPRDAVVGIGDSTTMRQLGIPQTLKEKGIRVLDPFEPNGPGKDPEERLQRLRRILREATVGDVFLTGTNAITQDGRLVNVDAVGNRIAGIFWGHPVSIVVVGRNKIVKDLDEAFYRIRNVIAPNHVRIRSVELGGRDSKTPCAVTGECSDCRATDRICNIFGVIEGKPFFTDLSVVMIDEDLGLGWDPGWPKNRIEHIVENYKRFVWVPPRR
ncbi:MAG TPA: lactate utilization protein [Thermodesulfobacteriota bacterium]|nr:lactate utilization protein [Thermodesulfobacteriota bacterium]